MAEQKLICQDCNQEYTLSGDDNPEEFECVCGGDLKKVKAPIHEHSKEPDVETGAEGRKKRRRPRPEQGDDIVGSGGKKGGFKLKLFLISIFLIFIIAFAFSGDSELTYEELMEKHGAPPAGAELAEWNRQNAQKDFIVYLQNYTMLEEMSIEEAKRRTSPSPDDEELGIKLIDYGETTIEGVTVYFVEYTGLVEDSIDAEYLFEINDRWYSISWTDQLGNPNRGRIDSQISRIIRDAKKVV